MWTRHFNITFTSVTLSYSTYFSSWNRAMYDINANFKFLFSLLVGTVFDQEKDIQDYEFTFTSFF